MPCSEVNQKYPIWDETAGWCRSCTLADGGTLWDSVSKNCVSACPPTAPKPLNGVCARCGGKKDKGSYWNGYECVLTCPLGVSEGIVCRSCADLGQKKPFLFEGSCVASCPETAPAFDKSNTCTTCAKLSPQKPFWDAQKHACTACPAEAPNWNGSKCIAECPEVKTAPGKCRKCADISPQTPIWSDG